MEHFAAGQLCDYLEKLFGIQTRPTSHVPVEAETLFFGGNLDSDVAVQYTTEGNAFPSVSEQGFILRCVQFQGRPLLVVSGGSPRAML